MTKKATKLLLSVQLKAVLWYLGIYALVIAILSIVLHFNNITGQGNWMIMSAIYSPKIYLLITGIVFPLISMEVYLSRGLTRHQYFKALTYSTCILSLVLVIPSIIAQTFTNAVTPISILINIVQMPLYFLIGWTAVVGFQFRDWQKVALSILCAIACGHIISTIPALLQLHEIVQLGVSILLLTAQIILLPRVIRRVPIKI